MPDLKDLVGLRFGRLLVTGRAKNSNGCTRWHCLCDCGKKVTPFGTSLRGGLTSSCGCLLRESARERFTTHGGSYTSEYCTWRHMRYRCHNPRYPRFKDWGGRGIRVCLRWRSSFAAFLSDMGPKPSPRHTIDRIDNDGNYEPNNCKWSTPKEQMQNRRMNASGC